MASYVAEQLKEKGNQSFRKGDYEAAEGFYSSAIQKNSSNPLLYTNRGNARLKLKKWNEAIDDSIRSIELLDKNMKAYFQLAQAQLAINHPNEALSSALRAYELCIESTSQTSSAGVISQLVLKCKMIKWELRERDRLRRRHELLGELEAKLEQDKKIEHAELDERIRRGENLGEVGEKEERSAIDDKAQKRRDDLRTAFALSDPENVQKREVPDYLVDAITFEIMHDPVMTKSGHSYERATLIEHLKVNPVDPLTRDPLNVKDLRPNVALKQACEDFMSTNSGWAYDW